MRAIFAGERGPRRDAVAPQCRRRRSSPAAGPTTIDGGLAARRRGARLRRRRDARWTRLIVRTPRARGTETMTGTTCRTSAPGPPARSPRAAHPPLRRGARPARGSPSSPRSSARRRARAQIAQRRGPRRPSRKAYEAAGAAAISVLTSERDFGGSLADLDAVRARRRRAAAGQGLLRRPVAGDRGPGTHGADADPADPGAGRRTTSRSDLSPPPRSTTWTCSARCTPRTSCAARCTLGLPDHRRQRPQPEHAGGRPGRAAARCCAPCRRAS